MSVAWVCSFNAAKPGTVRPQNTGDTCARGVTKVIRAANEHRVDEGQ
jgi:hypothetical protein